MDVYLTTAVLVLSFPRVTISSIACNKTLFDSAHLDCCSVNCVLDLCEDCPPDSFFIFANDILECTDYGAVTTHNNKTLESASICVKSCPDGFHMSLNSANVCVECGASCKPMTMAISVNDTSSDTSTADLNMTIPAIVISVVTLIGFLGIAAGLVFKRRLRKAECRHCSRRNQYENSNIKVVDTEKCKNDTIYENINRPETIIRYTKDPTVPTTRDGDYDYAQQPIIKIVNDVEESASGQTVDTSGQPLNKETGNNEVIYEVDDKDEKKYHNVSYQEKTNSKTDTTVSEEPGYINISDETDYVNSSNLPYFKQTADPEYINNSEQSSNSNILEDPVYLNNSEESRYLSDSETINNIAAESLNVVNSTDVNVVHCKNLIALRTNIINVAQVQKMIVVQLPESNIKTEIKKDKKGNSL